MTQTEVTFDTNMWIRLVNEEMRIKHADAVHILRVRQSIEKGAIQPFFCDATIFESVDRKFRKDFLHEYADPEIQMISSEETEQVLISSDEAEPDLPLQRSFWVMQNKPDRPVNEHWKKDIGDALDLGFLFIRSFVPKFGGMLKELKLREPLYKTLTDQQFKVVHDRMTPALEELDKRGVGMSYVRKRVAEALDIPVDKANLVELAVEPMNKVVEAVAEWVDGLVVCAHYAYQHQYICTLDKGGTLGTKSVMHPANRSWLSALGVEVLSAEELATKLNC